MKVVKLILIVSLLGVLANPSTAQFKKLIPEAGIQAEISTVIQDYQYRFKNISGAVLNENPQTTEYQSNINLRGSKACIVTQYSSGKNSVYSWHAIMYEGESFEEAVKHFKNLYKQLNNLNVKFGNYKNYRFNAPYEAPSESLEFTSIVFDNDAKEAQKLQLELLLTYHFPEWQIKIMVYEKEREDHEMGRQTDTDSYMEH